MDVKNNINDIIVKKINKSKAILKITHGKMIANNNISNLNAGAVFKLKSYIYFNCIRINQSSKNYFKVSTL